MTALLVYFFIALVVSFLCSLLESVLLSVSHAHIAVLVKENSDVKKDLKEVNTELKQVKDEVQNITGAVNTLVGMLANTEQSQKISSSALHVATEGLGRIETHMSETQKSPEDKTGKYPKQIYCIDCYL